MEQEFTKSDAIGMFSLAALFIIGGSAIIWFLDIIAGVVMILFGLCMVSCGNDVLKNARET